MNSVFENMQGAIFPIQIDLWVVFNGLNSLGCSQIAPSDRGMCYAIDCADLQPLLLFRDCMCDKTCCYYSCSAHF